MEPNLPNPPQARRFSLNPKITLAIIMLIAAVTIGLYVQQTKKPQQAQKPPSEQQKEATSSAYSTYNPKNEVAKVGGETIYQEDLDYEIVKQPHLPSDKSASTKLILEKIATDSAILQGAKEDSLISLDNTIYNSTEKDYAKRLKTVADIKIKVQNQSTSLTGTIVSIWFYNTKIGPLGLEKAKQLALEKITKLQADVKSGKITIEQAAQDIQDDSTLAQVDTQYKSNASFDFQASKNQQIGFNKAFNDSLWSLPASSTTEVFIGQDTRSDGQKYDALYQFGYIKTKSNSNLDNLENWLLAKIKKYALTY